MYSVERVHSHTARLDKECRELETDSRTWLTAVDASEGDVAGRFTSYAINALDDSEA
jgi:hypothetical protein